ncbi:hypothetical protein [Plantactinospora sp. B24E8]
MQKIPRRWWWTVSAAILAVPVLVVAPSAAARTPQPAPDDTTVATSVPFRPRLPAPTGPYPVGTTELHLVDHDRADPWVADRPRELMISLW